MSEVEGECGCAVFSRIYSANLMTLRSCSYVFEPVCLSGDLVSHSRDGQSHIRRPFSLLESV